MFYSLMRVGAPRTIVQVGAYTGDDDLIAACRRDGHRLFLFEPNPPSVEELRRKTAGAANIEVIPMAVSDVPGTAAFNVSAYADCSSLLEFDAEANEHWVHPWHPYKKFETVQRIEVPVVRLDTFMAERGLDRIDLLEVDAQGADLQVVQSLGARIADVGKIQIEVNIHSAPLYANSFGMTDAIAFFAAHGFERHVWWKQSFNREANVIFRNTRVYRSRVWNAIAARVEQAARSLAIVWVKLPRVLAVTLMLIRRRLSRAAS